MKNKSKFSKVLKILLVFIAFLGVFFTIRGAQKINIKTKDTSTENQIEYLNNQVDDLNAVISLKNSTIEEQNGTISSQADTISSQSSTISTQSTRINTLESELSSEYNYQYSIDVDFYVDSELYMSGKARNGGSLLISPTSPTKSGYTFTGWSLTNNGNVVDLSQITISSATSFYAIFEVEQPQSPTWDGTDLTGTTWELNSSIIYDSAFTYDINFNAYCEDNSVAHLSTLYLDIQSLNLRGPPSETFYMLRYLSSEGIVFYNVMFGDVLYTGIDTKTMQNTANNSSYNSCLFNGIIEITGGTDATNIDLINWLYDNATLVSYTPAN